VGERAAHRHAAIGRFHRLRDADKRTPEAPHGPPAESRHQTANGHHGDAPCGRRAIDALQKALAADQRVETVAVCEMLDRVQKQCEQHAAEPRPDAGQHGDDGKADDGVALTCDGRRRRHGGVAR